MDKKYPQIYWLKQYILLQNAQMEEKYSFKKLRMVRRRALDIYNKIGLEDAVRYINEQMTAELKAVQLVGATFKKRS